MSRKGSLLKVISYNYDGYYVTRQLLQVGYCRVIPSQIDQQIRNVDEIKRIVLKKLRKVINVYKNN